MLAPWSYTAHRQVRLRLRHVGLAILITAIAAGLLGPPLRRSLVASSARGRGVAVRAAPLDVPAALAAARSAQLSGDYQAAIRLYQELQQVAPRSPEAVEALYRQAQAELAAGDPAAAAMTASAVVRHPHVGRWLGPGLLLLGHALEASGQADSALTAYERYQALYNDLTDYLTLRAAAIHFAAGRAGYAWEALQSAYNAIDTIPSRAGRVRVAETFGQHALDANRTQDAAVAYQTALTDLPALGRSIVDLAQAYWRQVELYEAVARYDLADQMRRTLIREIPRSAQALQALRTSGGRFPIGDDDRTAIYFGNGLWQDAIAAADHLRAGEAPPQQVMRASFYRGLALIQSERRYEGVAALDDVAFSWPDTTWASDALWHAGLTLADVYPAAAAARLERLVTQYPTSPHRPQALFLLGRLLLANGQSERGAQYLAKAADAGPEDYYTLRARALINRDRPASRIALPLKPRRAVTEAEMATWRAWLTQRRGTPEGQQVQRQVILAADPRFRRGFALLEAGFSAEGNEELRDLMSEMADDPVALAHIAMTAHAEGHHQIAMSAGYRLFETLGLQSILAAPTVIQKLLFPLAYVGLVEREARQQAVDPLLLLALIKQESAFNPRAHSWAGARGLTQFMPSTARLVAAELGLQPFDPDDLYRPLVAVRLGTYHLARLLEQFEDNPYFALAGYNGGPGNVWRWAGGDPQRDVDQFVEAIPFPETRGFVKAVIANYGLYRLIYQ